MTTLRNGLTCLALFLLFPLPRSPASTKVGNGGDIVEGYLNTTRHALNEAFSRLRTDDQVTQTCSSISHLSGEQRDYCARFLSESLDAILLLNTGPEATPLQLTRAPPVGRRPVGRPPAGQCGNGVRT